MKKKIIVPLVGICLLTMAYKAVNDIITRLGMEEQNAQWHIIRNFIGRFDAGPMEQGVEDGPANSIYKQLQAFQIPRALLLQNIITGDKASAAKELCSYVKNYVSSERFANEYQKIRESAMPLTDKGMSLADLQKSKQVHQTNINNYKTDTKYVTEQQLQMNEVQKRIDAMMEAAKKPFPEKDAWLKLYPADPATMIKARLQEYIQLVATVDFTAKLTGAGKKQTFVNPTYEKKSLKWKAIYRAGKEVNDAVVIFVKEWQKEGIELNSSITANIFKESAETNTNTIATKADKSNKINNGNVTDNTKHTSEKKNKTGLLKNLKNKATSIGN
ncbi:MAG: hypothetical protein RIR12_212 [Bacteroidota bacterium]|jgi:hypothetical protein